MSEPGPLEFVLTPSRARRNRLILGACASAAVAAILASWTLDPAGVADPVAPWRAACGLAGLAGALLLLAMAARPQAPRHLRLVPARRHAAPQDGADFPGPASAGLPGVSQAGQAGGVQELRAVRAVAVGPSRIVLRVGRQSVVVWRDAIDPDGYRRLAARARWGRTLP